MSDTPPSPFSWLNAFIYLVIALCTGLGVRVWQWFAHRYDLSVTAEERRISSSVDRVKTDASIAAEIRDELRMTIQGLEKEVRELQSEIKALQVEIKGLAVTAVEWKERSQSYYAENVLLRYMSGIGGIPGDPIPIAAPATSPGGGPTPAPVSTSMPAATGKGA